MRGLNALESMGWIDGDSQVALVAPTNQQSRIKGRFDSAVSGRVAATCRAAIKQITGRHYCLIGRQFCVILIINLIMCHEADVLQ